MGKQVLARDVKMYGMIYTISKDKLGHGMICFVEDHTNEKEAFEEYMKEASADYEVEYIEKCIVSRSYHVEKVERYEWTVPDKCIEYYVTLAVEMHMGRTKDWGEVTICLDEDLNYKKMYFQGKMPEDDLPKAMQEIKRERLGIITGVFDKRKE
jgi:hypothetical protein